MFEQYPTGRIFQDEDQLVAALIKLYDDRKTASAYMVEFNAVAQEQKEDVSDFLNRVERMARKAHLRILAQDQNEVQFELILSRVEAGLRSETIARDLLKEDPQDMEELSEVLVRLQAHEQTLQLRRKAGGPHLVAESTSLPAGTGSSTGTSNVRC